MEKANRAAEVKGMLYFFIFGPCNIYYKLIQRIVVTSAKRDRIPAETALHFTGNAHCFGLPLKFFLLIFILHPQEELLLLGLILLLLYEGRAGGGDADSDLFLTLTLLGFLLVCG